MSGETVSPRETYDTVRQHVRARLGQVGREWNREQVMAAKGKN